jgi:hypothetical protein
MFKRRKKILMTFIPYEVNGKNKNHLDPHDPEAEGKALNRRQPTNVFRCTPEGGMGRVAQGSKI